MIGISNDECNNISYYREDAHYEIYDKITELLQSEGLSEDEIHELADETACWSELAAQVMNIIICRNMTLRFFAINKL